MHIGISPEVLSLPGAIDFIVDRITGGNKQILQADFDEAIKRFQTEWGVTKKMSDDYLVKLNGDDVIKISGYDSAYISIYATSYMHNGVEDKIPIINSRTYDKNKRIEMIRIEKGADISGHMFEYKRDVRDLGKVTRSYGKSGSMMESVDIGDLTRVDPEYDIATLDGVEDEIYMPEESYLEESYVEKYKERLEQKINASANRSGCCKYAGIQETDLQK